MVRFYVVLIVAAVVFSIYAVADCAFFDRMRIRGLSRGWWIVVIIFVPIIGGLLWFLIGRGRAGRSSGGRSRTLAPDDDAEFLRQLGTEAEQDERIRRMEQELADLDADGATGDAAAPPEGAAGTERKRPDTPETPGESGPSGRPNG
ncbi:PLDc N-terminal domain-containing protein [Agromyces sp. Root81]|uniref:PLDc N-terminal domain-containing protein n=1 Tax=Agromyces sp. Root81 TaxID=1736601 RepID=UPI0009E7C32A|nr:PLDc N-terminal domain-containing protein [Agromyces sp. Root81]